MNKEKRKLVLTHVLFCCVFGLSMIILTHIFGSSCPSKIVLRLPCPFCGMTRAWISAFKLDPVNAFKYHPLFLLAPAYLFFLFHDDKVFPKLKRFRTVFITVFSIMLVLVFVLRILPVNIDFFHTL